MAASRDYNYGSQLRHWLIKLIDDGKVNHLEWTDSNKQYFRLPWPKKDHPGSDDLGYILQEWANNRNRQEKAGVKSDYSTLKANFRNLLNKSEDFQEITEETEVQKQSNNFKMYKVLSPTEARQKKRERKMREHALNKRRKTSDPNLDDGKLKTVDEKEDMDILPSLAQEILVKSMKFEHGIEKGGDSVTDKNISSTGNSNGHSTLRPRMESREAGLAAVNTFCVSPPPSIQSDGIWSPQAHQQCSSSRGDTYDIDQLSSNMDYCDSDSSSVTKTYTQQSEQTFQYILKNVNTDNFHKCQFNVYYNSDVVLSQLFDKTIEGYRICFGDQDMVFDLLPMQYFTEEQMCDFTQFNIIKLPPVSEEQHSTNFIETLRMFDLGIIFRYDPKTFSFFIKRKCQSHVHFLDPHSDLQNQKPIKIEREDEVCVFSYKDYFTQIVDQNEILPTPVMFVSVGSNKSIIDPQNRTSFGIKIELMPQGVNNLKEQIPIKDPNNVSICYSFPTEFEKLLRELRNNKLG